MSVANRIAGFFSGLVARKQAEEVKKSEPYLELVERIGGGDTPDEAHTLKILAAAGKSLEDLRTEVEFRLKLKQLDEMIEPAAKLQEDAAAAEAALAKANEEYEKLAKGHQQIIAEARQSLFRHADLLSRIDGAKGERTLLLKSRHAERSAILLKEYAYLGKQQAQLRAGLKMNCSSAELQDSVERALKRVVELENGIEEIERKFIGGRAWMMGDAQRHELQHLKAELSRAREGRDLRVAAVESATFKGLLKIEARMAELAAELRTLTTPDAAT